MAKRSLNDAKFTQAEVAAALGVSLDTVARWARKGMPGSPGAYSVGAVARWAFTRGPWRSEQARSDIMDGLDG